MLKTWQMICSFFAGKERFRIGLLLLITILNGLIQAAGVASIMPFIAVAADPGLAQTQPFLASIYDYLGFDSTNRFLLFLGASAFLVLLVSNVLDGVDDWLTFRLCFIGEHRLSTRLLRTYMLRPYVCLIQRNTSELIKNVVSELERVVIGTLMAGISLLSKVIATAFIVALLLLIDPWVTISTAFVLATTYTVIFLFIRKRITALGKEFVALNTRIFKHVHEALGGAKEIKILGREEHFVERYAQPSFQSAKNAVVYRTLDLVPIQSLEVIAFGGIVFITVYLTHAVKNAGEILPIVAMYGFAAYRLIPALKTIFDAIETIRYNSAALEDLWRDFSEEPGDLKNSEGPSVKLNETLELRSVSFRYPGKKRFAVRDVDLRIRARSSICLIGPTGAGKSTTVDLILGLLVPESGSVAVDGVPITQDNARGWQRSIGYVPQVIYLTDDSIASNIALGIPAGEIDHARLQAVARQAQIHRFISNELDNGYDSVVGERGVNLSGGERQRIGIARALYHDPDVLVFDEGTNELDLETEARILESLRALTDKTLIFVSHKPSVAVACETVAVFANGRLAAQGRLAELIESNPDLVRFLRQSEKSSNRTAQDRQ